MVPAKKLIHNAVIGIKLMDYVHHATEVIDLYQGLVNMILPLLPQVSQFLFALHK